MHSTPLGPFQGNNKSLEWIQNPDAVDKKYKVAVQKTSMPQE
jgi:hypothetical protein